ncbi:KaiC associated regulatory domain-containing protein [Geoglobus acetivorans]|uniref:KaiC associated regulatory domain-containing protein n=1 Tax=Geoglobus acetivorans TaxID=565033 RepID=A0ABZ3H478_GEOAI|nr:KaiC associated regulatory domain-containing protein [Geoglobus acetivorans]
MEIIARPKGGDVDRMAEKVFMKSIEILGGLKKLVEYRNLTWLPSLAEAAYVIVLRNEALKTYSEIARELGITEATAKNIATADDVKVLDYIRGGLEERPKEHMAGGIAKLAYRALKESGELDLDEVSLNDEMTEILEIAWAVQVLSKIKGLDFPAGKEQLAERLAGILVKEKGREYRIEELLDRIDYPVKSPSELLHKLKMAASA